MPFDIISLLTSFFLHFAHVHFELLQTGDEEFAALGWVSIIGRNRRGDTRSPGWERTLCELSTLLLENG